MSAEQNLPDLLEVADQFARDLIANNVAALLPMFTPTGLLQALALQAEPDSAEGSDVYRVLDQGGQLLHIYFDGDDGDGTIYTQWVESDGRWKVDEIGRVD